MDGCKKIIVATAFMLIAASTVFAQSNTFLGPAAHLGIVKTITDDSAFAIAGEAGPKNLRARGIFGADYTITVTATNGCGSATSNTFNASD